MTVTIDPVSVEEMNRVKALNKMKRHRYGKEIVEALSVRLVEEGVPGLRVGAYGEVTPSTQESLKATVRDAARALGVKIKFVGVPNENAVIVSLDKSDGALRPAVDPQRIDPDNRLKRRNMIVAHATTLARSRPHYRVSSLEVGEQLADKLKALGIKHRPTMAVWHILNRCDSFEIADVNRFGRTTFVYNGGH